MKTYIVTPHLNRLGETVLMRGHNIPFCGEKSKIIPKLHLLTFLFGALEHLGLKCFERSILTGPTMLKGCYIECPYSTV